MGSSFVLVVVAAAAAVLLALGCSTDQVSFVVAAATCTGTTGCANEGEEGEGAQGVRVPRLLPIDSPDSRGGRIASTTAGRLFAPHSAHDLLDMLSAVEQTPGGEGVVVYHRNNTLFFDGLITAEDMLWLVTTHRMKYEKDIIVAKNGATALYSESPAALGDILDAMSIDKATLTFNNLHNYNANVRKLIWNVEHATGQFASVNAYITPANARGFNFHFDSMSVFIMQVKGTKYWQLYVPTASSRRLPIDVESEDRHFSESELVGNPNYRLVSVTLHQGDSLFIPRGVIHAAETKDSDSFHLTMGFHEEKLSLVKLLPFAIRGLATQQDLTKQGSEALLELASAATSFVPPLRTSLSVPMMKDMIASVEQKHVDTWISGVEALQQFCNDALHSTSQFRQIERFHKNNTSPMRRSEEIRFQRLCSAVPKAAFDTLTGKHALELALLHPQIMMCGGHIAADPDLESVMNVGHVSPKTMVYRRRGVYLCPMRNIIYDGERVPVILGINSNWSQDGSRFEDYDAVHRMEIGVVTKVKDIAMGVRGTKKINLIRQLVANGVLAISE